MGGGEFTECSRKSQGEAIVRTVGCLGVGAFWAVGRLGREDGVILRNRLWIYISGKGCWLFA